MNRYAVRYYNMHYNIDRTFEVEAESAFDALCRADIGIPRVSINSVHTTSNSRLGAWQDAAGGAELAASDNRHWQRNPRTGTIGACAWRTA